MNDARDNSTLQVNPDPVLGGDRQGAAGDPTPSSVETEPIANIHDQLGTGDSTAHVPSASTRRVIEECGYELLDEIGRGGFSTVRKAREQTTSRVVAIKILKVPYEEDHLEQFDNERKVLASTDLPKGLAPAYLFARADKGIQPFVVMEYIEGQKICQYANRRGLNVVQRIALIEQLLGQLQRLHEANLVFVDLSPNNVLVNEEGAIRFVDFAGACRLKQGYPTTRLREGGVGTPGFFPPAEIGKKRPDVCRDLYATSSMAVQLLTDRSFDGLAGQAGARQASGLYAALRALAIPRRVCRILIKGWRLGPGPAYEAAAQMQMDLTAWRLARQRLRKKFLAVCCALGLIFSLWGIAGILPARTSAAKNGPDNEFRASFIQPLRQFLSHTGEEVDTLAIRELRSSLDRLLNECERQMAARSVSDASETFGRALQVAAQLSDVAHQAQAAWTARERYQSLREGLARHPVDLTQAFAASDAHANAGATRLTKGQHTEARIAFDAAYEALSTSVARRRNPMTLKQTLVRVRDELQSERVDGHEFGFITITNLFNQSNLSDDELQAIREALVVALQKLTGQAIDVAFIGPERAIARCNLRQLSPDVWRGLLAKHPYGLDFEGNADPSIRDLMRSIKTLGADPTRPFVLIRADWLVSEAFAASPDGNHQAIVRRYQAELPLAVVFSELGFGPESVPPAMPDQVLSDAGLPTLAEGGAISRSAWSTPGDAGSPFHRLAVALRVGAELRVFASENP